MSTLRPGRQKLPSAGAARETLREKGQFWTPAWLAEWMAEWACLDHPAVLFDPAVGPGTFFHAAKRKGYTGSFAGHEVDATVLNQGLQHGLARGDLKNVVLKDFIAAPQSGQYQAIISNPPYLRHHRLPEEMKLQLRELARKVLGFELDGRTGLHVFFLLKCLSLLAPGGRLAFLLPADVCESVSSKSMWTRLADMFAIDAVVRFEGQASPFPGVDTNALVFLMRRAEPSLQMKWLRVSQPDPVAMTSALHASYSTPAVVEVNDRFVAEAVETGLSRPPKTKTTEGLQLKHLASVMRGIATGANEFFFMTRQRMKELGLSERHFLRAVGRTRDCTSDRFTEDTLQNLETQGRPSWLLNLGQEELSKLPTRLQSYLESGVEAGIHEQALISTRRPWYRMERRDPPPLLFAYLGRRDCRFILNTARVVPLTGFLCVYPSDRSQDAVLRLWSALNHPLTLENLHYVGKSYGGGALKVEPRQLDQLVIPQEVLRQYHLPERPAAEELFLIEELALPRLANASCELRVRAC